MRVDFAENQIKNTSGTDLGGIMNHYILISIVCNLNGECINDQLRMSKEHRFTNDPVILDEYLSYSKSEMIANWDPNLPSFYEIEGKEFTESEQQYISKKLAKWNKKTPPPYGRWCTKLGRPKNEIEYL